MMSKKPLGVLIIHGFTATTENVIGLQPPLEALGLPTRVPLLHGHGAESPEALRRSTWRDWLADGEAALKDLLTEVNQAIVVGHSMGGLVTLNLAADYGKSIDSIVLAAAAVQLTNIMAPGKPLSFMARLFGLLRKQVEMSPVYVDMSKAEADPCYRWCPTEPILSLFEFARLTRARLREVDTPTFIIQSQNDGTVSPESVQIIYDGLATPQNQKEILWFEKTEHEMFLDIERQAVIQKVVEYIKQRANLD
jgi:carboxylesterase